MYCGGLSLKSEARNGHLAKIINRNYLIKGKKKYFKVNNHFMQQKTYEDASPALGGGNRLMSDNRQRRTDAVTTINFIFYYYHYNCSYYIWRGSKR